MKVNLYDFDGTIYDGDSSVDFYLFCLKRNITIIKFIPMFILYVILYKFKLKSKEEMKERLFKFVIVFDNIDTLVQQFWEINRKKIKQFYLNKTHERDIIISASPYFILEPICKDLGVKDLIASDVDKLTGKYNGNNCLGVKKVEILNKKYKNIIVEETYSDSKKDIPMLRLAKSCYMVKGDKVINIKVK